MNAQRVFPNRGQWWICHGKLMTREHYRIHSGKSLPHNLRLIENLFNRLDDLKAWKRKNFLKFFRFLFRSSSREEFCVWRGKSDGGNSSCRLPDYGKAREDQQMDLCHCELVNALQSIENTLRKEKSKFQQAKWWLNPIQGDGFQDF